MDLNKAVGDNSKILAGMIQMWGDKLYAQAFGMMQDEDLELPTIELFSQCFSVGVIECLKNMESIIANEPVDEEFKMVSLQFNRLNQIINLAKQKLGDDYNPDFGEEQEERDPYDGLFNSDYLELDGDNYENN